MQKRGRWVVVLLVLGVVSAAGLSLIVGRQRRREFPIQRFVLADLKERDRVTISEENDRNFMKRRFEIEGALLLRAKLVEGVGEEVEIPMRVEDVVAVDRDIRRHREGEPNAWCAHRTKLSIFWEFHDRELIQEYPAWACDNGAIASLYARGEALVSERALARRLARDATEHPRDAASACAHDAGPSRQ